MDFVGFGQSQESCCGLCIGLSVKRPGVKSYMEHNRIVI